MPSLLKSLPIERAARLCLYLGLLTCTWDFILVVNLNGPHVKFYQLAEGVAILGALLQPKFRRLLPGLLFRGFSLCFVLLLIYFLAFAPWSVYQKKSLLYCGYLLFDLAFLAAGRFLLRNEPRDRIARWVLASMLIQTAVIFVDQVAFHFGYSRGLIGHNLGPEVYYWGISRPSGFSYEASYIASYFALGLTYLLPWATEARAGRPIRILALLAVAVASTITLSRTGWFTACACLGLYVLLEFRRTKRFPKRLVGALIGGAALVVASIIVITPRDQLRTINNNLVASMVNGNEGSGMARVRAHITAYNIAKRTRFLGSGLGASYRYWILNINDDGHNTPVLPDSKQMGEELIMSMWGQLLAEGGVLAVLLFLCAGVVIARRAYRLPTNAATIVVQASVPIFFFFTAWWLGNIARGDVWIWYLLWCVNLDAAETAAGQSPL